MARRRRPKPDCGSATASILDIAVIVGGNYADNSPETDAPIMIAVPVPGGQICGAGTTDNSASAGYLAGSPADPAQFSFYVQYNKSTSNPQGGVEIIVHSYNKPDGSTDTKLHHYRLKSTSISVLAVNTAITASHPYATAQFSSKANVAELVNGVEVSIEGNDIMQLNLTDVSPTSGVGDTLSVSVQRSKGGLWFSSNWDGAKTVEKTILPGGNLSVK